MTKDEFFAEFDKVFDELNNLADLLFPEDQQTESTENK